ncbi:MAG TPA: hypothetical protein PK357_00575 [Candidatus Pacearchaeota archaeon]|nr:hypothetical protein [Candidatus Pacearchaeota archaeon]
MTTIINKTQETIEELKKQGKIEDVDYKLLEKIDNLNKEVNRDYLIKEHNSWINSENCYVFQNFN